MFKLQINDTFVAVVDFFVSQTSALKMCVGDSGLYLQAVDKKKTFLSDVMIGTETFASWFVEGSVEPCSVNTQILFRGLKDADAGDIYVESVGGNNLIFTRGESFSFTLPAAQCELNDVPDFQYSVKLVVPARKWHKMLKFLTNFGDNMLFCIASSENSLVSTSGCREGAIRLVDGEGSISIKSKAEYEGLFAITPFMHVADFGTCGTASLRISLGDGCPAKIEMDTPFPTRTLVAPKA